LLRDAAFGVESQREVRLNVSTSDGRARKGGREEDVCTSGRDTQVDEMVARRVRVCGRRVGGCASRRWCVVVEVGWWWVDEVR